MPYWPPTVRPKLLASAFGTLFSVLLTTTVVSGQSPITLRDVTKQT